MSDSNLPAHKESGRFVRGNPGGPGRPPGSRNRASHRLILEILRDFELNRELVFYRLRQEHLRSYVSLVQAILPSRSEIDAADRAGDFDDLTPSSDDPEWREAQGQKSAAALRAAFDRQRRLHTAPDR